MNKKKYLLLLFLSCCLLTLPGCHHPEAEIEEAHPEPWTPSEVENLLGGPDPFEGFNRSMFSCTDFLMAYVADPLGRVYATIFPRPFVEHLDNVCINLEYPGRAISALLQAEWGAAGDESLRFLINSTLGIAGIFDVAEAWWHIPPSGTDMGQAFAVWGIGPGHTLMMPLAINATNSRDILGFLFDMLLDLKTYIPYAGSATALNRMVLLKQKYDGAVSGSPDPYKQYRIIALVKREIEIPMLAYHSKKAMVADLKQREASRQSASRESQGLPAPGAPEEPKLYRPIPKPDWVTGRWMDLPAYFSQGNMVDTMRVMMARVQRDHDKMYLRISWLNSDFAKEGSVRKIELMEDHPPAYYCFWKAPARPAGEADDRERLVLILPGIGSDCGTGTAQMLAEVFHNHHCLVATFDSTFNWRFVEADSNGKLPGYLPDDAVRMRKMLVSAVADLKQEGLIRDPEIILVGYSMGGMQVLKIAELEENSPLLGVSRYLAINPPVSTEKALKQIDELNAVSAGWTKSELKQRLVAAAAIAMSVWQQHYSHFDPASPFADASRFLSSIDPDTARCAAGIYLKISLRDILFTVHRKRPLPGLPEYRWGRRNDLYLAIDRVTMAEYATRFLAGDYPGEAMEQLLWNSSLYSLEKTLRNSPKITVFHNFDDFLLSDAERQWLDQVLGRRLIWFSHGSHLANLYYVPVHEAFCEAVGLPPLLLPEAPPEPPQEQQPEASQQQPEQEQP